MQLPDGQVIMHGDRPYDPKKAHEYYVRTRKLKGRKKAAAKVVASKIPEAANRDKSGRTAKQRAAWEKFLGKLPMAVEGASVADTEKFVNSLRGKTDKELVAIAAKIQKTKGKQDGAQVATIDALIKNRNRVRKDVATSPSKLGAREAAPQRQKVDREVVSIQKKIASLNEAIKGATPTKAKSLKKQLAAMQDNLTQAKIKRKALTTAMK